VLDIVPTVEFPPATPFTPQVTTVFDVPVSVAVNCSMFPSSTLELEDETVTITDTGGDDVELELPPPPPQPEKARSMMTEAIRTA
jgi:hypothetical protein